MTGTPIRSDKDRVFFIETPSDAFADTQGDVPQHRWSGMRRSHYQWLKQQLGALPDGRRVIDVGCGQSQFRDLLARHYACGIDFFPYPGAHVVTDLNAPLPFVARSCEVAVLSNVLEHVFEPQRLLAEVRRVLEPGGQMLIVVPFFIKVHQPPYDFYRYTGFALQRLCRGAGFARVDIEPLGNVFDIIEVDRKIRARILRRDATGFHLFAVRALLYGERLLDRALLSLLSTSARGEAGSEGCPQSFAVRAQV